MPKIKFFSTIILVLMMAYPTFGQFFPPKPESGNRPKIKHADPVFEDLTGELGARKGENELNVNFGYRNLRRNHHFLTSMVEYEFVPVDYLGLEIVLPYSLYFNNELAQVPRPDNQMEFLQWASQLTFYVNEAKGISMAFGFRNVFEIERPEVSDSNFNFENINYYPFLIFAKNWRDKYFFLFSGGPEFTQELEPRDWELAYNANSNFHYAFSEKGHMVGLELNKWIKEDKFEMYVRPQVIFKLWDDYILGIAPGIPVGIEEDRWSMFVRFAYEF